MHKLRHVKYMQQKCIAIYLPIIILVHVQIFPGLIWYTEGMTCLILSFDVIYNFVLKYAHLYKNLKENFHFLWLYIVKKYSLFFLICHSIEIENELCRKFQ